MIPKVEAARWRLNTASGEWINCRCKACATDSVENLARCRRYANLLKAFDGVHKALGGGRGQ